LREGNVVTHVVMWRLKDEAMGFKRPELRKEIKARLESLVGKIPEIRSFQVGLNLAESDTASEVVLVSAFDDMASLDRYAKHPEHLKVVEFVKAVVSERRVVDFEHN
jgi:hypothetical protein